ncbi:DUF1624 domain-containing protein [Methylobacterium sp. E-025]|jgi:uncharacterized membrane protein|uniref:DUF1624 domain-containing protein n=1 Tax=Methylobacterium sp. E-025 TaxID=2836561 RepID=UPI001FBABA9B|nr:heparan-alpha-glucosaminide N-acetyltransferase [Methylobacterium sp. E-025]MCJ2111786.1 DUF1624 domain-containing protein [Methylobacterium sp. E-025]
MPPDPTFAPTNAPEAPAVASRRIPAIDAGRAAALAAMAAYHLTWDLGYLRLTPENVALSPAGRVAAHVIAGTFLVLVGVGLVLMNGRGVRLRPTALRLLRVGGAAALITLATFYAFPDSFIFFGILHCIAVSSVLALPFLFVPAVVTALAGALVVALPHLVAHPLLDAPALFFLGLGRLTPQTNDYVPLFPWFGIVLLGVALGRIALPWFARSRAGLWQPRSRGARAATFAGRHSLAIYLVHQPLLLGALTGLVALTGPHPRAGLAKFRADYVETCTRTGGEPGSCRIAARCTADALRREGLWSVEGRGFTVPERMRAQGLSQRCYEASEGTAPPP